MSAAGDEAALREELELVKRREAEFRAKMVTEFLDRGERNLYLHSLHEERSALTRRVQEASGDIEILTRKLEAAEARIAALKAESDEVRGSLSWALMAPFRALGRGLGLGKPAAPAAQRFEHRPADGAPFTYYLHTSPFRVYRDATFTLRGWAWPDDGRGVTAVRANVDGRQFPGRTGIAEPEVISRYGAQPSNPKPGFEVTFETPHGRHQLAIEAQLAGAEWRTIMCTTIWSEAAG